jgi:hypothetical protein
MSEDVVHAEDVGTAQYPRFVDERQLELSRSFYNPIQSKQMPLFKTGQKKSAKATTKTKVLKYDVQLFS